MNDVLYLKHRPTTFKEVVGQPEAVKTLTAMAKKQIFPHALLFVGESGCGKTTLARIVREKLKCGDADFTEMDAASNRGIDMVRSIQQRMSLAPIGGSCRVWLIDECHQLTSEAQGAFLKILEDTPRHVYFFLATTDPQKLKPTIRTRCTQVTVRPLKGPSMRTLLYEVCKKEGFDLDNEVSDKIVEHAGGSARKALVLLNGVIGIASTEDQITAIEASDEKAKAFELARKLMDTRSNWATIAIILKDIEDDDPEGLRRMVIGYARAVLVGGKGNIGRAYLVIDRMRDNFFDSGKAGLAAACYEIVNGGT